MKKISVRVHPNSRQLNVKRSQHLPGFNHAGLEVYLTEPADKNQANQQLLEVLANYFQLSKNQIFILKGETGRNKLIGVSSS